MRQGTPNAMDCYRRLLSYETATVRKEYQVQKRLPGGYIGTALDADHIRMETSLTQEP